MAHMLWIGGYLKDTRRRNDWTLCAPSQPAMRELTLNSLLCLPLRPPPFCLQPCTSESAAALGVATLLASPATLTSLEGASTVRAVEHALLDLADVFRGTNNGRLRKRADDGLGIGGDGQSGRGVLRFSAGKDNAFALCTGERRPHSHCRRPLCTGPLGPSTAALKHRRRSR